jgi:hypothetical protein
MWLPDDSDAYLAGWTRVIRAPPYGFSFGGILHSLQEAYESGFRLRTSAVST